MEFEINLIFLINRFFSIPKMSRQKFKYPEGEKSLYDKIKIIFHNFWRAIIEGNKNFFGRWESNFKGRWELQVSRNDWSWRHDAKKIKEKVKTEHLRRTKNVLGSILNSGNFFKAINTWTVSLFRYSAVFIDWKMEEISENNKRTRKLLTRHRAHHHKDDAYRLHIK